MSLSYCRFQNTVNDLSDCSEHFSDKDLSPDEEKARKRMIKICVDIALDHGGEIDREVVKIID